MQRLSCAHAVICVLVACVIAQGPSLADETRPGGRSIAWTADFAAALQQAEADGKMIMVDCYTGWCTWCKVLDRQTYADIDVVKASRQFVNVKVDGEESREFVQEYRVTGYPTILFLDSEGNELYRVPGYCPPGVFAPMMNDIAAGKNPDKVIAELLRSTPKDAPSLWRLVNFHLWRNNHLSALPLLERLWRMPADTVPDREKVARFLGTMYLQSNRSAEFEALLADVEKLADRKMKETALTLKLLEALEVERDYPRALELARELTEVVDDEPVRKELEALIRNLNNRISQSEPDDAQQTGPPAADTPQTQPREQ